MADIPETPESLTLRYLRRLDEKLDRVLNDIAELRTRTGAMERGLAELSGRVDRLTDRVERIERRLELSEAT